LDGARRSRFKIPVDPALPLRHTRASLSWPAVPAGVTSHTSAPNRD
jgi:hypothetical protein